MIMDFLHSGPKSVGEIVEGLGLPQANVSQHLAALRAQELVATQREGNMISYSLVSEKVVEACDLFHEFLADRLQNNHALASHFPAARPLLGRETPLTGTDDPDDRVDLAGAVPGNARARTWGGALGVSPPALGDAREPAPFPG